MRSVEGRKYAKILLNILVPIAVFFIVCFGGFKLMAFFAPFVVGWVIAMIANPLVRFLERKLKLVRRHGSVLLIIGVLALVITAIYLLLSWGLKELSSFVGALPEIYEMAQEEISLAVRTFNELVDFIPAQAEGTLLEIASGLSASVGEFLQETTASAGGAVARSIPDIFVNTIVVILSSYLFLAEHDRIVKVVRNYLPEGVITYWGLLKKDIWAVIGGYFLAQFKIMFVVALLLFVGLLILKVRYAVFLALGIALLDFLPMFGTGTALIPWALVKLFAGEYMYAFQLAVLYVVTQAVRQIIQPKIVGDSMGLSPLATLFLLYIGFQFRGLAGMIIAVPVGMIFIKFYEYGAFDSFFENLRLLWEEIETLRGRRKEEAEGRIKE